MFFRIIGMKLHHEQLNAKRHILSMKKNPDFRHLPKNELGSVLKAKKQDSETDKESPEENIRITADGKLEIVSMNIKLSILKAEQYDGKNSIDGGSKDKHGNIWMPWISYFTGKWAEDECIRQGKNLLNDDTDIEKIISLFPGEIEEEKILNFVYLLGLKKAGYCCPVHKTWSDVGSMGCVWLSKVCAGGAHGIWWNDLLHRRDCKYYLTAEIGHNSQDYLCPFVVFEHC